ncbi:hypothetical protein J2125_000213 [Erwinia toletana]|uniref:Uncharacterized protein n=1 Tax=Winslowiella toletana TaxID=92490 RepID=A0ABS4P4K3_9GAMM|nr:hypothetical protein [Winslowiella toletana]MBP2167021.1 hypothetical protein [Winslowiella toletana]
MENHDESMQVNFSHFEFLTMHTGQYSNFLAACQTEDDIGAVLRLHLLLEKDLEVWCACSSENGKIFAGFGENLSLEFSAKNQLAYNFDLSEDLYKVIKRFNKIRNVRAHQVDNFAITDAEIDSLTSLIGVNYPSNLLAISDFGVQVNGGEHQLFTSKGTPNRLKLIMIYSMLKMRMCDEALRKIGRRM